MRTDRGARRRFAAAAVAMVALVPALAGAGTLSDRAGPARPAGPAPVAQAPDVAAAVRAAAAQGTPVEVVDQRTPTRTVYAQPDGTMAADLTARPVRVARDGGWVDVDTTVVRRPDGSVGPVAAAVDLSFSGGGTEAPLVTYGDGAGGIELTWPGELPEPELAGDTVTYPEVLPGVDLRLRADVDGFGQYLVIKDRAAAFDEVRLGLRTHGVELHATEADGLVARDGDGTVVFAAPTSQMWDAAEPPRRAEVGVSVEDGALVLRPDRDLLADPGTRYPVTVDPQFHTADKQAWTSVLSGKPGTEYWNSSGDPPWAQVGQCYQAGGRCNGIGEAWTYWNFDTSFLTGRIVMSADLNLTTVYSPSCNERQHLLYKASGAIRPTTNWGNRPGGTLVTGFTAKAVYLGCEGWKEVGLGVTPSVNRGGTTTYFVRAANGGDQLAWRKYENNAKLRVQYNRVPDVPTDLATDPPLPRPCRWCNGVRYLADDSVRLLARLRDPDGDAVRPLWHVDINGAVTRTRGAFKTSGSLHDHVVDTSGQHGRVIAWAVKAEDSAHGSGWAHGPRFVVDRERPTVVPGVTGTTYVEDNRWHGGVDVPGTFAFDSAGVGDVDHFLYGWTDPPTTPVDADALGGEATVSLTPPGDGPRDLYVRSVDRAGNQGPVRVYHFYVRAGNGPLAQWSFEGNATDEAFLGDRDGTLMGDVDFVPGAVGQAVLLNGVDTRVTAPPTLRTDASFSVSAWVRLDDGGYARAAVSQDGTNFAGFDLWYRPDDGGRWAFGMARSDESYQGTDMAWSAQQARTGVWTHLTGVYDAVNGQLRLYVNGTLSGTADRQATDWNARGWVQIGRTMWNGDAAVDHWDGLIDEVTLYDRVLTEGEVRAAVAADGVPAGHWRLDETTGTTARNEVPDGEMAVLHHGAAFTGDAGAVNGAVRLDGVDDAVTTAGPAVHTDQSFTVAAWVRPQSAPPAGQTYTALSQDGTAISGFFLGYRALGTGDRWEVYLPSADEVGAPASAVARSTVPAELDTWTHLAVSYDAAAGQLRLSVDGVAGAPVPVPATFDATGPFVIGRGLNGGPTGYWPGDIDEVRTYSRALSAPEIQAVVSRDDVALGEWRLDGNAEDATGGGRHGTLAGAPGWTGGQTAAPDPTDLAITLDGGDYVSLPHTVDVRGSFAVAAWVRLDAVGGTSAVVSQDGGRTSAFQLFATPAGQWALSMAGSDVDGGGTNDRVMGGAAQAGVWTHLVGVYDAGARELSLYVNGVRVDLAGHHQTWDHPAGGLQIGAGLSAGNRQNRLRGAIDDVTVYGRVLFAEEVRVMAGRDLSLAHHWRLDEGSGDTAADTVGRRPATLAGAVLRTPGRLGNAVALDGGHLTASGVDVRTDRSFTVTAWVRLSETCDPGTERECRLVAVSLDGGGESGSKFLLGHTATQSIPGEGHWVFEMPEPDGTVTKAAVTVLPSDLGNWVHLAGVYDEPTGKLWLYVNGIRKGDGRLIDDWHGTGGLQLGRGRDAAGDWIGSFPGGVDDVRLYSGRLDDGRISNLYLSYPEAEDGVELPAAGAGHWTFDENTGTTAGDSSGRQLAATMHGGADWVGGRIGHAGRFDGVDGYAETAGPVLDTGGSFSVSAWAYLGATGEDRALLAQAGAQTSAFSLSYDAGRGSWAASVPAADTADTEVARIRASEPVFVGHWAHLGLVYHAELDQLRLYVNGRLSGALVGVETWSADGPLSIGRARWAGGDGRYFQGGIDDVRAFGRALTDGEMREVYDDSPSVVHGDWRFDDQTVRDWSWRENPTTASGPVSYVDGPAGSALQLDGGVGVSSERWGVPEYGSLTVSAWVYLAHEPAVQTVVAQDGDRMSSFALQYRPSLDRWVFGAWTQDADDAELVYARSGAPAVLGEWTHLTGVYDHAAGELRLYVDGELAGARDGVTLWLSTGGLTIGRGMHNGAPGRYFTGAIDEVRIELGILPADEIAALAGRS